MRFIAILIVLSFGFIGCESENESPTKSQTSETETEVEIIDCPLADEKLRNPTTYPGVVELINALPKPLTANCFLANYDPPFGVYAVDSTFSAQPSGGETSPRIFLLIDDFMVSVVPDGTAKNNVEFGKVLDNGKSVKGDILFPINEPMADDGPFAEIMDPIGSQEKSDCRFCHRQEVLHSSGGFQSEILPPNALNRVSSDFLKTEAQNCDLESDAYRCNMLRLIFSRGKAIDVEWPF